MGNFLKKQREKGKYSYLTNKELEEYKNRAIELKDKIEKLDPLKDYKLIYEYSMEIAKITKILKKYQKYMK